MRKRKRVIALALLALPCVAFVVLCWLLSRPLDPGFVLPLIEAINTDVWGTYATEVPEVNRDRVADGIYLRRDDIVEIGLLAFDFQGVRTSEEQTLFVGRIVNFGDLRVTGIRATIWLSGEGGAIVDAVPISLRASALDPGEVMTVQARHIRGQNTPRLLSESVYFGRDRAIAQENSYGQDVVIDPSLDWIARSIPWATYEAVWTSPGDTWESWTVDITCDGEGAW
jgi:hypothetical protein